MSLTRKQHYYPSSLIRFFADSKDKVHVYNAFAKTEPFQHVFYRDICYHKDTYETGLVDNVLENKIASFESEVIPIIASIINSPNNSPYKVSDAEIDKLWKFMWLQTHRTDAGRIKVMSNLNGRSALSRVQPVSTNEIKEYKNELKDFNGLFKQEQLLETLLAMIPRSPTMTFHVCIGDSFITSDNPVIMMMEPTRDRPFDTAQLLMPISPFLCLEFQGKACNCSNNQYVLMTNEKLHKVNKYIVNTANYYVISNQPFDVALTYYINFRFTNPHWLEKMEFC